MNLKRLIIFLFAANAYAGMPVVDATKNMQPAAGDSETRIRVWTGADPVFHSGGGSFRIACAPSHMSNDDPLVFPGVQNATHHHTFYGNTSVKYNSDLNKLDRTGNSTCSGGIMNLSGYWMPSMVDTRTNAPFAASSLLVYYKVGAANYPYVTSPPKGLRMLAGNSGGNSTGTAGGRYTCISPTGVSQAWTASIPNCQVGYTMQMRVDFPNCWDGVNLDSADHKSHMRTSWTSNPIPNKCPASHPVLIPTISFNANFAVTEANQTTFWRLSSDNYDTALPGGYSAHGDWINGWGKGYMDSIVDNCLKNSFDCHAHLLGNGRHFY